MRKRYDQYCPIAHALDLVGERWSLLGDMGWVDDEILDLGGLPAARGLELFLSLWLTMRMALGTSAFHPVGTASVSGCDAAMLSGGSIRPYRIAKFPALAAPHSQLTPRQTPQL